MSSLQEEGATLTGLAWVSQGDAGDPLEGSRPGLYSSREAGPQDRGLKGTCGALGHSRKMRGLILPRTPPSLRCPSVPPREKCTSNLSGEASDSVSTGQVGPGPSLTLSLKMVPVFSVGFTGA